MQTFKEHITEAAKPFSLHDDLVKNHGFTHKEYHMQGSRSKDAKGDDHYHTDEEVTPKYVHDVLIKHGYRHLTKSKADSRVSLPAYTHYEKEQMGSRHSVTVHSQAGYGNAPKEVSHITTKHYVVRD